MRRFWIALITLWMTLPLALGHGMGVVVCQEACDLADVETGETCCHTEQHVGERLSDADQPTCICLASQGRELLALNPSVSINLIPEFVCITTVDAMTPQWTSHVTSAIADSPPPLPRDGRYIRTTQCVWLI